MPETDENNADESSEDIDSNSSPIARDTKQKDAMEKLAARRAREKKQSGVKAVVGGIVGVVVIGAALVGLAQMPKGGSTPTSVYESPQLPRFNEVQAPSKSKLHRMPNGLMEMAGALGGTAALVGSGLFLYARFTRRKYVQFDKIGILISDSARTGEGDARFIPWGCLYSVDVIYPRQKKDAIEEQAVGEILQNKAKGEPVVVFYVDDNSTVRVNWRDLISGSEPGAFINALKTWSPEAIGACQFPGEDDFAKIDHGQYTQLWFKYYSQASDRKRTNQLEQGETLQDGRYTIAGRLGSGGQGTAYLAVDAQPPAGQATEIVLKEYILPVHRGQQVLEQTVAKLQKEADILRSIDHPNIVKMLGEFIEDHRGYLIMEYVSGRSLKALVAEEGPQPEHVTRDLALQICDILEYLHGLNPPIVHRDLTPDNLILQDDGVIKLVDFNVAHQLESAATATVVGKHCYIPPEQFRGRPTTRSDYYAFGCSLYYLMTGEEPEPLTASHPRHKKDEISEEMDYLVATCSALDANKRFADIAAIRAALTRTAAGVKIDISQRVGA